jgi:uncharacterized membrane protein YjgN (DUF898 family)
MGELKWPESLVVGYLSGLGIAMYVVAWNSDWSAIHSVVVVALLAAISSAIVAGSIGRGRSTSIWRATTFLTSVFALSTAVLAVVHTAETQLG